MSYARVFWHGCLASVGSFIFLVVLSVVLLVGPFVAAEMIYHSIRLSPMQALMLKVFAEEADRFYVSALDGHIEGGAGSGSYCYLHTEMVARLYSNRREDVAEIAVRLRNRHFRFPGLAPQESQMKVFAEAGHNHIVFAIGGGGDHFGLDWRCRRDNAYPIDGYN